MWATGLDEIRVRGFRTLRDVALRLGPLTALVGEANAGKSNLIAAVRALLDPDAPPFSRQDLAAGAGGIDIEGRLADGRPLRLGSAPASRAVRREVAAAAIFMPAALRGGPVVDGPRRTAGSAAGLISDAIADLSTHRRSVSATSTTSSANVLVAGIERCCAAGLHGVVILIEEPELFLRPQAQRYLYRLLREAATAGNQVIYSTHAPAFLNVARLEELVLVERDPLEGTLVLRPEALASDEGFRAMSEFDAERSELFLSRAAILVEGRTEKLALPFVFRALGLDADREAISIVECGGKSNIPLFARICRAVGVPFVAVHDRDAPAGGRPSPEERRVNAIIEELAGREHTVVLEPDFEGATGLRRHKRKPEQAWKRFASLGPAEIPPALARAVELAMASARD